jgi:4-hydroxybenzoyl-CoA thioesterase
MTAGPAFQQQRAIRFSDCDPAAIVFYPQYFVMLNAHIEDWFTEGLGVDYYRLVAERRIGLPTVRLEVDFVAVSRMGDKVALELEVERVGATSLTLQRHISGVQGDRRMTARQVLVTTSLDTHRAIELPDDVRAALRRAITTPTPSAAA